MATLTCLTLAACGIEQESTVMEESEATPVDGAATEAERDSTLDRSTTELGESQSLQDGLTVEGDELLYASGNPETASLAAPSCIGWKYGSIGPCLQVNFQVYNNCKLSYRVRMDIEDFPDTACKSVGAGKTVTLTSACGGWDENVRGVVRC